MRLKLKPPSSFSPEKLRIKDFVFYGVVLGLGLTFPPVAHSQTLQRDRFETQLAQSAPGSGYSRLSLGYPTPITDQYGVTGITPNIQEWYNRVLAKMRSTFTPSETPQSAPSELQAPGNQRETNPNRSPSSPATPTPTTTPAGGARGGFTPQDRGAPGSGGAGGARFRPPSLRNVPD